jgi:DNA replication protein DnaC
LSLLVEADRGRAIPTGKSTERLTGALLDRLTHHVNILEMNGESYRLKHSRQSGKP